MAFARISLHGFSHVLCVYYIIESAFVSFPVPLLGLAGYYTQQQNITIIIHYTLHDDNELCVCVYVWRKYIVEQ